MPHSIGCLSCLSSCAVWSDFGFGRRLGFTACSSLSEASVIGAGKQAASSLRMPLSEPDKALVRLFMTACFHDWEHLPGAYWWLG